MAQPDIVRGTYVTLLLGDGTPVTETFAPICGITAKGFTAQVNTNDVYTRDCANPEDIPLRRIIQTGRQWDLSGSGQLDRSRLEEINGAIGKTRNWRYLIGEPADDLVYGGYYEGPGVLTSMVLGGDDADFASVDLTIASDGEFIFTPITGA